MTTIKDIAKHAGLSLSTVSVVLNGKGDQYRISKATQEKVFSTVRELDYRPNVAARRLRGDSQSAPATIAIFWTSDFRAPMLVRFLRGLQAYAEKSDRKLEFLINTYKNNELHKVATQHSLSMFNAAIICNISAADQRYLEENMFSLPIVLYNRRSESYCSVNIDDSRIGRIAAEVFASRGHKRVGIISAESVFSGMDDRHNSFLSTVSEKGLEIAGNWFNANSIRGGVLAGEEYLRSGVQLDCIYCASDAMATGVMRSLYKRGVRVPEDLEIISIGNGDIDLQENFVTSLSVVQIPIEEMGGECLRLLLRVMDREVEPPYSLELPVEYIPRESCGPTLRASAD